MTDIATSFLKAEQKEKLVVGPSHLREHFHAQLQQRSVTSRGEPVNTE